MRGLIDVEQILHTLLTFFSPKRAGRDGKPSDCVLYYSAKDVPRMIRMINGDANADLFVTMVKYAQQVCHYECCCILCKMR